MVKWKLHHSAPIFIAEASSNHGRDLDARPGLCRRGGRCRLRRGQVPAFQDRPHVRARDPGAKPQAPGPRANGNCRSPIWRRWPNTVRRGKSSFPARPFYLEAVAELAPFVDFYKVASYELAGRRPARRPAPRPASRWCCPPAWRPWTRSSPPPRRLQRRGRARHHPAALRFGLSDARRRKPIFPPSPRSATATGCQIGWSDHTRRPAVIERAVHRWGARAVEFHLDLDGKGAEYAAGHCWLPRGDRAGDRAHPRKPSSPTAPASKARSLPNLSDREWRADPADGMRPLKHIRAVLQRRSRVSGREDIRASSR